MPTPIDQQIKKNQKELLEIKQRLTDIQQVTYHRWENVDQDIRKFYILLTFLSFFNVFVVVILPIILLTKLF